MTILRGRDESMLTEAPPFPSHVSCTAQAFEGVLAVVIHDAPGALGSRRRLELGDDLFDRGCAALDRDRDVLLPERTISFAVAGQVERDDRDRLALVIAPISISVQRRSG